MKTYSELIQLQSYAERLEYLHLNSSVGEETFGFDRYLNQRFYRRKRNYGAPCGRRRKKVGFMGYARSIRQYYCRCNWRFRRLFGS
nr:MAG TPA: hypothetical protein [Caudoviricetes sp.]